MSYYNDPETQALLSSRQLWFIPLVNPDGYIDNLEKSAGNRNRRKNTLPGCSQIQAERCNLNRNYETLMAIPCANKISLVKIVEQPKSVC